MSTTTRITSQIPANPSNPSHHNLTSRQLARRRRRQRRRQRLRQRREEQFRQEPQQNQRQRQQQQRPQQLQENHRRRQQQQRNWQNRQQLERNHTYSQHHQRQEEQRQRQQERRQPTSIITVRQIFRSHSDIEHEHEYYLSLSFPEELDDIDPDELLELLELENMNPVERETQQQLKQYEQSIQQQHARHIPPNIGHSAQYITEEELLKVQQAKPDEIERYMDNHLLILQQDQIHQLYQIQATEDIENDELSRND
ncbi:unnamed protein product [Rotaria sp. Silwood2]|nr:unnamed protein product [Rotaria sp. Silwood2]CAF4635125.1 unnamed protein product [Rotaria sp. Silwood2]